MEQGVDDFGLHYDGCLCIHDILSQFLELSDTLPLP